MDWRRLAATTGAGCEFQNGSEESDKAICKFFVFQDRLSYFIVLN